MDGVVAGSEGFICNGRVTLGGALWLVRGLAGVGAGVVAGACGGGDTVGDACAGTLGVAVVRCVVSRPVKSLTGKIPEGRLMV